jgi:type VI protein secretion system component VasF
MTLRNDREIERVVASGTLIWFLVTLMLLVMMGYLYSLDVPAQRLLFQN